MFLTLLTQGDITFSEFCLRDFKTSNRYIKAASSSGVFVNRSAVLDGLATGP